MAARCRQRNRAALAHVLLSDPDVLLLDEPTNFLDVEGLAWLEQWLNQRRGALLLVSHDRHFLDLVVNRIVEIENHQLQEYQGDYTAYVREQPTRLRQLENQYRHEQELLAYEAEAIEDRREAQRNPSQALRRRLSAIHKSADPARRENRHRPVPGSARQRQPVPCGGAGKSLR